MNNIDLNNSSDLKKLFNIFPFDIQLTLENHVNKHEVLEIVLDLGKRAEARFLNRTEYISKRNVSWQDLDYIVRHIGKFNDDNRAGIEKTLHRISCICNREGLIIGLTCRVGRSILGPISFVRDYLIEEKSFLILGKPGVGKTTIIREMARVLSDEFGKRVIIIDTSNEIAGDSNIPHSSLGRARRMQVKKSKFQHNIMLEAVENHMPEVIIIDEISTELEVLAARTIAERGVQLIGTVHGTTLSNLIRNPVLVELIGGLEYVTLSDDEAKRRGSQKSILERRMNSSFDIGLEVSGRNKWTVYNNIGKSVDLLLQEKPSLGQIRQRKEINNLTIKTQQEHDFNTPISERNWRNIQENSSLKLKENFKTFKTQNTFQKPLKIYCYCLSSKLLENLNLKEYLKYSLTNELDKADLVVGLKKYFYLNQIFLSKIKEKQIPVYMINVINIQEMGSLVKTMLYLSLRTIE
jgi:stage III sporulation protein SpoIIIAA